MNYGLVLLSLVTASATSLAAQGDKIVVWTLPAPASLKAQRGDDGVLSAALIELG